MVDSQKAPNNAEPQNMQQDLEDAPVRLKTKEQTKADKPIVENQRAPDNQTNQKKRFRKPNSKMKKKR